MNKTAPHPWTVFALDASRAIIYDADGKDVTAIAKADAEIDLPRGCPSWRVRLWPPRNRRSASLSGSVAR